jgi:hypothetical protein
MTTRLEMGQLEEAIDWASSTAWQGEVNVGQLKLEVDAIVETELEVEPSTVSPTGSAHLPRVVARRLQHGGWRSVYFAMSGAEHVIGRYVDEATAVHQGRAYAKVQDCPFEVES